MDLYLYPLGRVAVAFANSQKRLILQFLLSEGDFSRASNSPRLAGVLFDIRQPCGLLTRLSRVYFPLMVTVTATEGILGPLAYNRAPIAFARRRPV
jgi:hypothetical protein